jgi:sec-independent protein translocase protein TatA
MLRFGELALIALIVMIIFGAGKLPNVLGDLGKGMKAFKDGMKDDESKPTTLDNNPGDKNDIPPSAT